MANQFCPPLVCSTRFRQLSLDHTIGKITWWYYASEWTTVKYPKAVEEDEGATVLQDVFFKKSKQHRLAPPTALKAKDIGSKKHTSPCFS